MQKPARCPAAFTLIEVMLAMAIMAVICGTIYQFTGTTVRVANEATRIGAREQAFGGLRRLLAAQFAALPSGESRALSGATNDGEHGRQDVLQMLCPAGNTVLTPDARGLYQVAFELRKLPASKGQLTLVMNREPWSAGLDEEINRAVSSGSGFRHEGWVRLLDDVRALEIDYFDPRLNTWVDKWNDPTMTPSLVRVCLAMEGGGAPYEFIERVPGGGVPRMPANLLSASIPGLPGLPPGVVGPPGAVGPNGVSLANNGTTPRGNGTAPTAPPPGPAPSLPTGLRPPTSAPPMFDPSKPFMAPDTGTGLPPGFTR